MVAPMERLLLVLDELDDTVSLLRHLWLGASQDMLSSVGWFGIAIAPGLLVYVAHF
jgi:hypothetical protein